MNVSDILKQHQALLDKVKASMRARAIAADDLLRLPELKRERIDDLTVRIDALGKQKQDAIRRYDDAIVQHQAELTRLKAALVKDEAMINAVQRPPDTILREAKKVLDQAGSTKGAAKPTGKSKSAPNK